MFISAHEDPLRDAPIEDFGRLRITEIFLRSWWRRWLHAIKLWKTPVKSVRVNIPFEVPDPKQPHMLYAQVGWAGLILTADMIKGTVTGACSKTAVGYMVDFHVTRKNVPVKKRRHRDKRGGRFNRQQNIPRNNR